jgi:beta-lactamase regulating signal transducer with metallopeptidase domain/protein involved in polysaccharide export with SLBB domain
MIELSSVLAAAVAESLLHFLWQGTLLGALAFILLRRAGAHASAKYALGIGTLVAMLLAPIVTTMWILSGSGSTGAVPTTASGPSMAASSLPVAWVLGIWACGVVVCGVRLAGGWVVARRLTTRAVKPVADEIQAMATRVAARLSVTTPFRVLESTIAASPMMIGWLKPVVLLPTATLAGLSPSQLEALLAHEFAHMRRHDYLVNLLQSAIETLLFYHPAVWLVSRSVRESREQCCDDLTISVCDRLTYVSALSSVAALRSASPALAASGGSLRYRVERLLRPRSSVSSASFSMGWLGVIPVALVIAAAMPVASTSQISAPPAMTQTQTVSDPAPEPVVRTAEVPPAAPHTQVTAEATSQRESAPPPMRPALPVVLDFLMPTTQAMAMPQAPPAPQPAPVRRVAVGDTIKIDFYGLARADEEMRKDYVVGTDGAIQVKHLWAVPVAGKTFAEVAHAVLNGLVEKRFYPPGVVQVVAIPAEPSKEAETPKEVRPEEPIVRVQVQGQVVRPGEKALRGHQMTLHRALAAANGFTPMAGQDIEIHRRVGVAFEIIKLTRTQLDAGDDPQLLADDIVIVKTGYIFFVAGDVNSPGQKIWAPGMTVGKAISMSNGLTTRGKLSHIERPIKDAAGRVIRYERIKNLRPETEVLPEDTLHVARKWFGN